MPPSTNPTNPLTRTLNTAIASAGQTAGDLASGVGSSVDSAGRNVQGVVGGGVARTTRNWGDSTRELGNEVRDAAGAGGPRSQTSNNPLGLSGPKGAVVGGRKQTAGNPLGLGGKYT
jgi:hypothetical protein